MYSYGTFGKRLLAFIIDQLIIFLIFIVLGVIAGFLNLGNTDIIQGLFSLIFIIYSTLFIWRSGSTIGKKILKLKVVNGDYQPVSFWQALLRESLGKIVSGILNLGYLWVIIDKKRQGWHDKIAKTYVVQIDQNSNLLTASSEVQITTGQKVIFWLLFLLFGIPLGFAIIFTLIYLFIGSPVKISGNAMNPNYTNGQYYMTNKTIYRSSAPQTGDVVILMNPKNKDQDLIKRVIGLPGDQVSIRNGAVYINGQRLQESYLSPGTYTKGGEFLNESFTIIVPQDSYFVLGDNRDHSSDSRNLGFISKQNIISKLSFCYWLCNTAK